jgi:hypothetical protein
MFQFDGNLQIIFHAAIILSFLIFLGSFIVIPVLIARMPQDYFLKKRVHEKDSPHSIANFFYLCIKNLAGFFLLLSGLAMLILPGQGIICIIIGLSLINLPGKHGLIRKIVQKPVVFKALNWIRAREKQPPFISPKGSKIGTI